MHIFAHVLTYFVGESIEISNMNKDYISIESCGYLL